MTADTELRLLVVGASSGLGQAVSRLAAQRGAHVALAARRREPLDALVAEVGPRALALSCDVRDPADCERIVEETVAAFGGLDAVIYAPGALPLSYVEEATAEDWRATLETNVIAPALVARAAIPHLRRTHGRVVFLSSDITRYPRSALGLYGVSKLALNGLCDQLRREVHDVRFTAAILGTFGPTDTEHRLLGGASGGDPARAGRGRPALRSPRRQRPRRGAVPRAGP
jgi:NAD(P)-dependent dehydrogenase (short-subunit alcohol dehydrogenase family)